MTGSLILKCGSASRSSGQWSDDDYDVLDDGVVVGRIFLSSGAPQNRQWMWASGHSADSVKRAAHGYEATREQAMAALLRAGDGNRAARTTGRPCALSFLQV